MSEHKSEDGRIALLNKDCMDYMKSVSADSFDLTVTSPPYNIGKTHRTGNFSHSPYKDDYPENEYQLSQVLMLNEIFRVTKKTGSIMYNHKNRISKGLLISPYEWLLKTNWIIKQEIVWINGSQNFDKIRFYPQTERIYWLVKDTKTTLKNDVGLNDYISNSRWPAQGVNSTHSRAFPLNMVKDILRMFPDTRKMFDPYLGSGTTAIAAHYEGCEFTGCEISKDYYNSACDRFEKETAQVDMFNNNERGLNE